MDVIFGVIWWIELNDPVNVWKIEAPLCNIRAQEDSALRLAKFEIRGSPLLLLLLAVDVLHRYVYVIQQVTVKLDGVAA